MSKRIDLKFFVFNGALIAGVGMGIFGGFWKYTNLSSYECIEKFCDLDTVSVSKNLSLAEIPIGVDKKNRGFN